MRKRHVVSHHKGIEPDPSSSVMSLEPPLVVDEKVFKDGIGDTFASGCECPENFLRTMTELGIEASSSKLARSCE